MTLVSYFFTFFFFFNDTATTEIYTLSLHDALPIYFIADEDRTEWLHRPRAHPRTGDRKSTRLNSSHANISYAVFCLKKKNNQLLGEIHYHNRYLTRFIIHIPIP